MIGTIKRLNNIILFSLLLISFSHVYSQANCCNSTCSTVVDSIIDPNNQCLLYANLGDGLVQRNGNQYEWREGGVTKRRLISLPDADPKNSGFRRLYICPTPFTLPRRGLRNPPKQVYLAKYYFYNSRPISVLSDGQGSGGAHGYSTTPPLSDYEREKRGTPNNWFVFCGVGDTSNGLIEYLNNQQDGTYAHMYSTPPACEPPFLIPWNINDINLTPPPSLLAVGEVGGPRTPVLVPPQPTGNLDMIVTVAGGGALLIDVYQVNKTTGNVILIGSVNCDNNIRTSIPYTVDPGNFIWVSPNSSMFFAGAEGGFDNNYLGGTYGTWQPAISRARFPDNICLFGTESPVVGVDISPAGLIQFRFP